MMSGLKERSLFLQNRDRTSVIIDLDVSRTPFAIVLAVSYSCLSEIIVHILWSQSTTAYCD